ncbi:MAG: hypothetical protein F4213_02795 [Boseongicola sp. SB0677_bin_26]|nr:hypothetical protein [Boseongicola sp. SB0665_bin_10]MYG24944.1 hypothetical protein [Boseongicola sp. SB0677_bin_26]
MKDSTTILSALLLAGALALAGCGGGGDTDSSGGDGMTAEERVAEAERKQKEAEDAYAAEKKRQADEKAAAEAAKMAEMAKALHKVLASGVPDVPTLAASAPSGFGMAKDADKSSQSIMLEGDMLSGITGYTKGTGDTEGYYGIQTANDAKAAVFGVVEEVEHEGNAPDGDRNDFVTAGTYRGIPGTFRCTQDPGGCKSQKGSPDSNTGWWFKPNDPMARVSGSKIEWGWWLGRDDGGDVMTVNRFHSGTSTDLGDSSGMLGLGKGTASYEGDATGQYAVTGDSGAFEATASLVATFGGDSNVMLSGRIHEFMGADGMPRDWTVMLKEHNDTTGGGGSFEDGMTVWNGYEMAEGWNAKMYNGSGTKAPNTILGDFRAENQGGRMAGVFGAEKK